MRPTQYFLEEHMSFVVNTLKHRWLQPHFLGLSSAFVGEYTQALVRPTQCFLETHVRFVVNTHRSRWLTHIFWGSRQRFVVNTPRRW